MTTHSNAWHVLLIVCVVLAWLKLNQRRFGDSFSPFNLLLFGWVGPLLLSTMSLSSLERPWSSGVWWSLGWTTLALIACVYFRPKPRGLDRPAVGQNPGGESRQLTNTQKGSPPPGCPCVLLILY